MTIPSQVLIVEDEAILAKSIEKKLQRMGYRVAATTASGEEAIQIAGTNSPDLVLMDIKLNGLMDGIEAAQVIQNRFGLPVVYLTAYADDETLQRAKITQPFGYLLKPFQARDLQATIETALYKHSMDKILRQRNRQLALLNQAGQAFNSSLDLDQVLATVLEETRRLLDVLACSIWLVVPETGELVCRHATGPKGSDVRDWRLAPGTGIAQWTVDHKASVIVPDAQADPRHCAGVGQTIGLELHSILSVPLQVKDQVIGVLQAADTRIDQFSDDDLALLEPLAASAATAIANARLFEQAQQEIVERKQAEQEKENLQNQILQLQKMEAIGRLTAGIAHDFNNLLTAVNGFAELLQHRLPADSPFQRLVTHILTAGQHAAELARQLLVFSRGKTAETVSLDLNAVAIELEQMLQQIVGSAVRIRLKPALDPCPIKMNPAQIEQIIVNLVVNARDAMPHGGTVTLETATLSLDEAQARRFVDLEPGPYVTLNVRDEGEGMTEEVKSRIFEPFFTTKSSEQGTGLGLATCYGIVKQNQGHISVVSEPGRGAAFTIYLPWVALEQDDLSPEKAASEPENLQGTETILLVEDEAAVRELAALVLEERGYHLLKAANGQQALELAGGWPKQIDLLLTDTVMPVMGGKELVQQIKSNYPDIKIIFFSGYAGENVGSQDAVFIQKPFVLRELVETVRKVLDGG